MKIDIVIPAYNEEASIGLVLQDIPAGFASEVVVCNNGSKDATKEVAESLGATVVDQPQPGYGSACLKGLEYLRNKSLDDQPDIVVFIDGDYSDYPQQMPVLVEPIIERGYDLVIGSRNLGNKERGAMMPQQMFGNWLATSLIRILFNYKFTDLGPFRAIRWDKLNELDMRDPDFGWTVEMQVKAAKQKMKCIEVPVDYRRRVGVSKISGTIKGTLLAGHKILWTIFKLVWK